MAIMCYGPQCTETKFNFFEVTFVFWYCVIYKALFHDSWWGRQCKTHLSYLLLVPFTREVKSLPKATEPGADTMQCQLFSYPLDTASLSKRATYMCVKIIKDVSKVLFIQFQNKITFLFKNSILVGHTVIQLNSDSASEVGAKVLNNWQNSMFL